MNMGFDALRMLPSTTQEEFDRIRESILALAANTEPEEYTDVSTGICLTVVRDIPNHPLLLVTPSKSSQLLTEESAEAIRRLFSSAGIGQKEQEG